MNLEKCTCYTGGAEGTDYYFELYAKQYNLNVVAYSFKTKFHNSDNKYELSIDEFNEGVEKVYEVNEILKRTGINKYLKFLARNWMQVKFSKQVFAVGELKKTNQKFTVKGGTAWAVQMAINEKKSIYFFDQNLLQWFTYDYCLNDFFALENNPTISATYFTGIGTRKINLFGISAIETLFKNTFS